MGYGSKAVVAREGGFVKRTLRDCSKRQMPDFRDSSRLGRFVLSYADCNANVGGMIFYTKLAEAYEKGQKEYPFRFCVGDYKIKTFNEQNVKNEFAPGLKV